MSSPKLAFTTVAESAAPAQWLYVVHGIFGAGRNWASIARRVVRERRDWGALLIDLREHGGSTGFAPPHTIGAAAADLHALAATAPAASAILGHSFGGKVALTFSRDAPGVRQAWIIDSTPAPGVAGGSAQQMLEIVRTLPQTFPSRDAAVAALVQRGVITPTAMWMVTNLVERDGSYTWRFNLASMSALLDDFFRTDLWSEVEHPRDGLEVHLVKASESNLLQGADLERARAAVDNARTFLHIVRGGHWLNADNPDALVELLCEQLPEPQQTT